VTEQARNELAKPFTVDELKLAVFGSNASGAPGPDGFTFVFYQHFWAIVYEDLIFLMSLRLAKINHAMLCLLFKELEASIIQKFRPISLLDCSYKIISKILTNRLTVVVPTIVDKAQTTFI
jgi:hypothetical protein